MTMEVKKIGPFEFALDIANDGSQYVHIALNGEYYDSREFHSIGEARDFFADPLREDRAKSVRTVEARQAAELASVPYYAADYEKPNYGRRIGRKPGC